LRVIRSYTNADTYSYGHGNSNSYANRDTDVYAESNTDTKNSSNAEESTDTTPASIAFIDEKEGHRSIRFP
jgi:hypothetical protein